MILPTSVATSRRADLPPARLVNLYAETAETVAGKVVLFPRPALTPRTTIGSGPTQGLYQQPGTLNGSLFTVSGGSLYRDSTALGSVGTAALVQMAGAAGVLMVATGGTLYRTDGATLTTTAFPDDAPVSAVAYLGGYAVAARAGTRRFYYTLDPTTWDGLDYLSAEQSTDPIVGMAVVVDQLWVFCERHTEVFFLTGDADAPFQRVQGRVFDKGSVSRDCIVNIDNTVAWVGDDAIVYRGEGTPIRISNHGIEDRIAKSATASAWTYIWKGHSFYVLQLDAETLIYDVATQLWHEAESFRLPRWRARIGIQVGREFIAGDDIDGSLWTLADDTYRDGDDLISRLFTLIVNERTFIDNLYVDCSTGETVFPSDAQGVIELRTSRDGGRNWGDWRSAGTGVQGQYRKSVPFRRVGMVDRGNMIIQVRVTDNIASAIANVRINETGGGRS